jgi:hypothetical protein
MHNSVRYFLFLSVLAYRCGLLQLKAAAEAGQVALLVNVYNHTMGRISRSGAGVWATEVKTESRGENADASVVDYGIAAPYNQLLKQVSLS